MTFITKPRRNRIPRVRFCLLCGAELTLHTLSGRQWQVARLIRQSYSNKQIATELGITDQTVKNHIRDIFDKWDMPDRTAIGIRVALIECGVEPGEGYYHVCSKAS